MRKRIHRKYVKQDNQDNLTFLYFSSSRNYKKSLWEIIILSTACLGYGTGTAFDCTNSH
jgi:hypothetical protein